MKSMRGHGSKLITSDDPNESPHKKIKIDSDHNSINLKLQHIRKVKSEIFEEHELLNVEQDAEYEKSGTYSIDATVKAALKTKKEVEPICNEILAYYCDDVNDDAKIFEGIQIAIEFLNPYLTDKESFAQEINKLTQCIQLCETISTPILLDEAAKTIQNIKAGLIPWITYEHTRLFDIKVKIKSAKYEPITNTQSDTTTTSGEGTDEGLNETLYTEKLKQVHKLIDLQNTNIDKIKDALEVTKGMTYYDTLESLLATAYEYQEARIQ